MEIAHTLLLRRRFYRNTKQRYFSYLQTALGMGKILMKRAAFHHRLKVERKVFFPWREFAFLVAKGIARMSVS